MMMDGSCEKGTVTCELPVKEVNKYDFDGHQNYFRNRFFIVRNFAFVKKDICRNQKKQKKPSLFPPRSATIK